MNHRTERRITQADWNRLLEALKKGNTRRAACGVAGISAQTLYNRLAADLTFLDAVTRAEAEAEAFYAGVIKQAAPEDWRAAESWLKRLRRDDWGDGLDVKIGKMGDDELRDYILGGSLPDEQAAVESGGDSAANGAGASSPLAVE